jgi:adenylate cyclase
VDNRPTILAVDDVPQNLRLLEAVLGANGFSVATAASGEEALASVASGAPDLVLLDVMMPGLSGYDVCKRLRDDTSTRFLPVVMVTSSDAADRLTAIEAGADDFVQKPFDQQELLARVRSLVRIKQYHDTIERQAVDLAVMNANLEARVAEQVAEIDRLGRLRRFLSPTLAELVLTSGDEILRSHRRELAVLFADLRGWTAFSVSTEPEEVMGVVGEYHEAMGELILRFDATVGWFAGDGLMIWFNDPIPCEEPALRAAAMAIEMRATMAERTARWRRRGHELDFSVGVGLGYATIGRIGFEGRYDYGAVGSVMNLASRLCDQAASGEILISERVLAEIEAHADAEPAGELTLKGFPRPIPAFRLLQVRGPVDREVDLPGSSP